MKTTKPLGQALRLEIETDPLPGAVVNLVRNPSGDLGSWSWITPVTGSTMNGAPNLAPTAGSWDATPVTTTWDSVPATTTWEG